MKTRYEVQKRLNDRITEREKAKEKLHKLDIDNKEYIKYNIYIFILDQVINELNWVWQDYDKII